MTFDLKKSSDYFGFNGLPSLPTCYLWWYSKM